MASGLAILWPGDLPWRDRRHILNFTARRLGTSKILSAEKQKDEMTRQGLMRDCHNLQARMNLELRRKKMVSQIIHITDSNHAIDISYNVYLNPSSPSITLPPAAARLLALQNLKSNASVSTIMRAEAIIVV